MKYGEILSSGKKIKKIRKELGLKQHEITGGEITRNLISIIENDKAALTEKVAKVIAHNINKACMERDIEYHVSSKYLLESPDLQAKKVVDNFLEKLTVDNFEIVDDIEEFLIIYNVGDKKRTVYEKIGDLYNEVQDYYKSYTYYIKAYESIEKDRIDDSIASLILKLSNCCKLKNRYEEALKFNNLPLKEGVNISIEIKLKVLLNKIEILREMKDYDNALDEIENLEEGYEEIQGDFLFQLYMLKALCYKESRYYRDSLEVYKKIKEEFIGEDKINLLLIDINIIEIYILLRDTRNIRKYIDECLQNIISNRELYKEKAGAEILMGIAKGYKYINEINLAAEYYNHCIYAAKRNKQFNVLLKALDALFEIYEDTKEVEEVDNIKNELLEIISTNVIEPNNKLIFKLIGFYNNINDKDGISGIVSFILN